MVAHTCLCYLGLLYISQRISTGWMVHREETSANPIAMTKLTSIYPIFILTCLYIIYMCVII